MNTITRILLFLISFGYVNAQTGFVCDSLLKKDYDFWYSNADVIFEGQVVNIKNRKNFSKYTVAPLRAFAGGSEIMDIRQNKSPNMFQFEPDTNYVFLVFSKYKDPYFSPCVIFGKSSKMEALTDRYGNYCGTESIKDDCYCTPYYDPVCGCDGYNYNNPCEAACDGIYNYFKGPCFEFTPMLSKPSEEEE